MIVALRNNREKCRRQDPLRYGDQGFAIGWVREMECHFVARGAPIFLARVAPSDSRVAGSLAMLTKSTETADHCKIIGVVGNAVVVVFVGRAHMEIGGE